MNIRKIMCLIITKQESQINQQNANPNRRNPDVVNRSPITQINQNYTNLIPDMIDVGESVVT